MRSLCLVAVLAAGLVAAPAPMRADETAPAVEGAIQGVISQQMDAFRADDFGRAFDFASPGIRQIFGSAERFGQMVRNGYPMVWRPADIRFAELETRDGRRIQSVLVTDEAGVLHVLDYEMIPGTDGWRINGVWLRQSGGAGA